MRSGKTYLLYGIWCIMLISVPLIARIPLLSFADADEGEWQGSEEVDETVNYTAPAPSNLVITTIVRKWGYPTIIGWVPGMGNTYAPGWSGTGANTAGNDTWAPATNEDQDAPTNWDGGGEKTHGLYGTR